MSRRPRFASATALAFACACVVLTARKVSAEPGGRDRFEFILWQSGRPASALAGLRRLGVTAAALIAERERPEADIGPRLAPLRAAGLGYYLENTATDFYSPYHRWRPGLAVNAAYADVLARWRAAPDDPTAFWRVPSLVDPGWRERVAERLTATVRAQSAARPLFYDLGDEMGIADLSAAWDFDRSPASLAAMRRWLAEEYGSLAALNRSWGSQFAQWDSVVPDTTFEAMRRTDGNYASWSDFKAWMDVSFAAAVRAGTQAIHDGDPAARAGLEGAQMAGWGGYDYGRLASAVDVMEIYGDATNLDIARDLNPRLVTLATAGAADPDAARSMWRAALRGSRGFVLWDEDGALVGDDGAPGPGAARLAPVIAELRGPAGAALLDSTPARAPIAILYSQASFRAQWMLDHRAGGDAWVERGADGENDDNAWRAAMRGASDQLLALGLRPLWIAPETLAAGVPADVRLMILPRSLALGDAEAASLAAFRGRGGHVVADVAPGAFDAHLHPRVGSLGELADALPSLFESANAGSLTSTRAALTALGVVPEVALAGADGSAASGVEMRVFQTAHGPLVALLVQGPARSVTLTWRGQAFAAADLARGERLGEGAALSLAISGGDVRFVTLAPQLSR